MASLSRSCSFVACVRGRLSRLEIHHTPHRDGRDTTRYTSEGTQLDTGVLIFRTRDAPEIVRFTGADLPLSPSQVTRPDWDEKVAWENRVAQGCNQSKRPVQTTLAPETKLHSRGWSARRCGIF